jgi:23S rRNA pseudouridine1911/1915/1917 synthase
MEVKVIIHKKFDGLSIKEFLKEYHVGKPLIEKIRVNKLVTLNNKPANNLELKIKEGDILIFTMEEKINFELSNNSIEVVYEDDQILIVNKPSGILIHPDGNESKDTLVNRVARYYFDQGINIEVRYAHRIDIETSGLVLFCKDFLSHSRINYEVENHIIIREYLALVNGKLLKEEGIINYPIGSDRHINNKYRVSDSNKAKKAITKYKVIKTYNNKSLISCILQTGRTHQIRVHLSYLKHPLLGDVLYGGNKKIINRVALHSYRIKLINPITLKEIEIKKDIPLDMEAALYAKQI